MNESGNVLAFIGDAVLSLQVREYLVSLGFNNLNKLQQLSTSFVSAKAQADYMHFLLDSDQINEEEMIYFKRGRNAKSASSAKNQTIHDYRMATGFEALWGYLYLSNETERLEMLWNQFKEKVEI